MTEPTTTDAASAAYVAEYMAVYDALRHGEGKPAHIARWSADIAGRRASKLVEEAQS